MVPNSSPSLWHLLIKIFLFLQSTNRTDISHGKSMSKASANQQDSVNEEIDINKILKDIQYLGNVFKQWPQLLICLFPLVHIIFWDLYYHSLYQLKIYSFMLTVILTKLCRSSQICWMKGILFTSKTIYYIEKQLEFSFYIFIVNVPIFSIRSLLLLLVNTSLT